MEGKNKMTMYLRKQISEVSRLILKAQEIKGYNISNSIHTTAQMNEHDHLDNHLLLLIDDLKALRGNLVEEKTRVESHLWQVNCYISDALNYNNKLMSVDTQGRKKKNA
mgnify:FL=1